MRRSIGEALDYDFFAHFRPVGQRREGDTVTQTANGDGSIVAYKSAVGMQGPALNVADTGAADTGSVSDLRRQLADKELLLSQKDSQLADKERTIQLLLGHLK